MFQRIFFFWGVHTQRNRQYSCFSWVSMAVPHTAPSLRHLGFPYAGPAGKQGEGPSASWDGEGGESTKQVLASTILQFQGGSRKGQQSKNSHLLDWTLACKTFLPLQPQTLVRASHWPPLKTEAGRLGRETGQETGNGCHPNPVPPNNEVQSGAESRTRCWSNLAGISAASQVCKETKNQTTIFTSSQLFTRYLDKA